jgi:glutamine synthetase adenylyltransferase
VGANTAEQIAALRAAGLVSDPDARALSESAALLRSVDHAVRLVTGKSADGLPEHVSQAESVESLVRHWGLLAGRETLAERVSKAQQEARRVYREVVRPE